MALPIVITKPATNYHWIRGNNYTIEWEEGDPPTYPIVELTLYKGTSTVSYIGSVSNSVGSKSWTITNTIITGTDYRVFITEGVPE